MRARDSQRQAVYRWEDNVFAGWSEPRLTLDQCKRFINRVCDDYGVPHPVEIADGRGTTRAWASAISISLPKWARVPSTILHEMAHYIIRNRAGGPEKEAPHGRVFATLMLDLWRRYLVVEPKEARKLGIIQRPRRVWFARLKDIPKPVRRVRRFALED